MRGFIPLLLFISNIAFTQSDLQLVQQANEKNEQALLNKYNIIDSPWFETNCMQLVNSLEFNKITQCKLFDSKHINAYVLSNGHVYFSLAMMELIYNKHQWASILAHENAHLELSHYIKMLKKIQKPGIFFPKAKIKKMMIKHEEQADAWSKTCLVKYNYDPKQIHYFLKRVIHITGNKKTNGHLKPSKRMNKITVKEIIDTDLMANIKKMGAD